MVKQSLANLFAALLLVCAVLIAWVGTGSATTLRPGQLAQEVQDEQRTEYLLTGADSPQLDIISATQRLRLHSNSPITSTVNAAPPNYPVGSRQQFYVGDLENNGFHLVTATLKVATPHAYFYVSDGYRVNQRALQTSASYFESHIYPTDRRIFGSEPAPGIDNDPHITILLTPIRGAGGYFSDADSYPKIVNSYSNQRKMIYMSVPPDTYYAVDNPANYFMATLAHEFQHMIESNVMRGNDNWLNEGASEIASYVNGYDAGGSDVEFTLQPDTQLNTWSDIAHADAHYGASYLFLRYLMDHYGGQGFMSGLLTQQHPGVAAIDAMVKQKGNAAGFDGAFEDWIVANILNDSTLAGGRYSYSEGGRAVPQRSITSYPATRSDTVHQYAADYLVLSGRSGRATITFQGSSNVPVLGANPHSGKTFWYSNRRDTGDATLTRAVDLSGISSATLKFWTWYSIEDAYDYAYVEASSDGGQTWNILSGRYSTTGNPNGESFGPAWTGNSGSASGKNAAPHWVEEAVNLNAYAGKPAQIRFEMINDGGYNLPGFALDDISIPEAGYSDDAEADNGWNAQGFVRIGPRLPEKWFVALVEKGRTNSVRVMSVDSQGRGTLAISGLGAGSATRSAVLIIAPMAPKTTEIANYSVRVSSP